MIDIYNGTINGFREEFGQKVPTLDEYILEGNEKRAAFIVCPGGAYTHKAMHEGKPIAEWLNTIGINAFVLDYRVDPYKYPCSMEDLKRAIRFIRYNHELYNIDPNKIGVIGFSAGGHLAASACVHFDLGKSEDKAKDEIDLVSSRPDMSVLCYPVITFGEYAHKRSIVNLLGEDASDELINHMSLEKQVKENTPPAFIWHTLTDESVPFQNSILYAEALKEKGVDAELHIFPRGRHGLGMKDEVQYVTRWNKLCEDFLKEEKFI